MPEIIGLQFLAEEGNKVRLRRNVLSESTEILVDRVKWLALTEDKPPPDTDPLGLIARGLKAMAETVELRLRTHPQIAWVQFQWDYDGMFWLWQAEKLLAKDYPDTAALIWPYQMRMVTEVMNARQPHGYHAYNRGLWAIWHDPRFVEGEEGYSAGLHRKIFAWSAGGVGSTLWPVYYRALWWNDVDGKRVPYDKWPSYKTGNWSPVVSENPVEAGVNARDFALHTQAHQCADNVADLYLDGDYRGVSYKIGWDYYVERIVGRFTLGVGADLNGGQTFAQKWVEIADHLDAAGGDWTQVPDAWRSMSYGYEFSPLMFGHVGYQWEAFYYDARYQTDEYAEIRVAIEKTVVRLCDLMLDHWFTEMPDRKRAIIYEITAVAHTDSDGLVSHQPKLPGNPSPDLCIWVAGLFAFAYRMTKDKRYYDAATDLIDTGLTHGNYLRWFKGAAQHFGRFWQVCQNLGWTGTTHREIWEYDLKGGETWP